MPPSRAAVVATGYEKEFARASGRLVIAEESGTVLESDADHITLKTGKGTKRYNLEVFTLAAAHSFANHQRPMVSPGDTVKKGQVIADTSSTAGGELAIGKNLRVAFLSHYGEGFEDAIVVSERLVRDDVLTSVQVKEHVSEIRETKLGEDIMTADIPNVSERKLRNLDVDGVIRVGSEVVPGDILVGKLTPRGETQISAEERLLQSIFGDKAKDMRDTSKVLPSGEKGKIVPCKCAVGMRGTSLIPGSLSKFASSSRNCGGCGSAISWRTGSEIRGSYPASRRLRTCRSPRTANPLILS